MIKNRLFLLIVAPLLFPVFATAQATSIPPAPAGCTAAQGGTTAECLGTGSAYPNGVAKSVIQQSQAACAPGTVLVASVNDPTVDGATTQGDCGAFEPGESYLTSIHYCLGVEELYGSCRPSRIDPAAAQATANYQAVLDTAAGHPDTCTAQYNNLGFLDSGTGLGYFYSTVCTPTASLRISVPGATSTVYTVGQTWTLNLTSNQPNSAVTLCAIHPDGAQESCTLASQLNYAASTDGNGNWTASNPFPSSAVGSWTEWECFGSVSSCNAGTAPSSNKIAFTVVPAQTSMNASTNTASPGNAAVSIAPAPSPDQTLTDLEQGLAGYHALHPTGSTGPTSRTPATAMPDLVAVQGYNVATGLYETTADTMNAGDTYLVLWGTFPSSGNTVNINGTALPASDITYQGSAGVQITATPDQINVDLGAGYAGTMFTVSLTNIGGTSGTVTVNGTSTAIAGQTVIPSVESLSFSGTSGEAIAPQSLGVAISPSAPWTDSIVAGPFTVSSSVMNPSAPVLMVGFSVGVSNSYSSATGALAVTAGGVTATIPLTLTVSGTTTSPVATTTAVTGVAFPATVLVTASELNVRSSPYASAPLTGSETLHAGDEFTAVNEVVGESVGGNDLWWVSSLGNYVWSGGTEVAGVSAHAGFVTGVPVLSSAQGYNASTSVYETTADTMNAGDTYLVLWGTFPSSGNTVNINGTALPASDITYQGSAGVQITATPDQINVDLGASYADSTFTVSVTDAAGTSAPVTVNGLAGTSAVTSPSGGGGGVQNPPSGAVPCGTGYVMSGGTCVPVTITGGPQCGTGYVLSGNMCVPVTTSPVSGTNPPLGGNNPPSEGTNPPSNSENPPSTTNPPGSGTNPPSNSENPPSITNPPGNTNTTGCVAGETAGCDSTPNACGVTTGGTRTCDGNGNWGTCNAFTGGALSPIPDTKCPSYCAENPDDPDCVTLLDTCKANPSAPGCPSSSSDNNDDYCNEYPDNPDCITSCQSDPSGPGCATGSSNPCDSDPTAEGCTTPSEPTGGGTTDFCLGAFPDCFVGVKGD